MGSSRLAASVGVWRAKAFARSSPAASVAAAALLDPQMTRIECPLCALFCLEYESAGWRLVLNAEVAHLGASLATFVFP